MRKVLTIIWRIITFPFQLIWRWISNFFRGFKNLFTEEPEDTPLPDAFAKAFQQPADILDHLNELRKHIFRGLAFFMVTTAVSFIFVRQLLDWITKPIGGIESLQAIEVTEPISVVMRICLLAGFSVALPYIVLEIWLFAAPGLKRRARILGLVAIPIAFIFFIAGMAFAYYMMMPTALPFLVDFMDIPTAVRPSSYVRFATGLMFWIGIAFEFPLVIFALAGMGLVKAHDLASQWRIAVVVIAVLSAAITPTIDPVNMGLVMGPMILLYFLSIGLAYIAQGRHARRIQT
jgi:sec-independent protein translocase protein TatC